MDNITTRATLDIAFETLTKVAIAEIEAIKDISILDTFYSGMLEEGSHLEKSLIRVNALLNAIDKKRNGVN